MQYNRSDFNDYTSLRYTMCPNKKVIWFEVGSQWKYTSQQTAYAFIFIWNGFLPSSYSSETAKKKTFFHMYLIKNDTCYRIASWSRFTWSILRIHVRCSFCCFWCVCFFHSFFVFLIIFFVLCGYHFLFFFVELYAMWCLALVLVFC